MTRPTTFPLCWPAGWPRTASHARERAKFHTKASHELREALSIGDGLQRVERSLSAMGVPEHLLIVSTNLEPRLDGRPKASSLSPDDPGVAVYWTRKGKQQCLAVDRYTRVADNLAAIAATLDAMRAIDRHGGAQILDRAFTGFVALPAPEQWWQVLGFQSAQALTRAQIDDAHRRLAMKHHPDRGGDDAEMARINAARDHGYEATGA